MARFTNLPKLSKQERERLVFRFCDALVLLDSPVVSMKFLTDLLSKQEVEMLARRLKVAELLFEGKTYGEIRAVMHVSSSMVARVRAWLEESGEGFSFVLKGLTKQNSSEENKEESALAQSWKGAKRHLPLTFWPINLMEEIARSANKRQKIRLRKILGTLYIKSELYKSIDDALEWGTR